MRNINFQLAVVTAIAAVNGALYFFPAEAGGEHTPLIQNSNAAIHTMSAWGALNYALIMRTVYGQIELRGLKPSTGLSWTLAILGPFAALSMFTAAKNGANRMNLSTALSAAIGIGMFLFRSINNIDGAARFPDKYQELKMAWPQARKANDKAEMARIALTLYAAIGYALCTTDTIYAAIYQIGLWLGANPSLGLSIASYVVAPFGAIGIFSMVLYWTHRGIKQLTFGGKMNSQGINPDPSDRYTLAAFLFAFPMFLAAVGAATSANGQVFGQLGSFAFAVKISTALIYGIASVIPGLAGTIRPKPTTKTADTQPLLFAPGMRSSQEANNLQTNITIKQLNIA